MATREAACHCGQLRLEVTGDPFAVSICNCLDCQRRTGSAFGMQAGFKADQVEILGRFDDYARISDEADRKEHVFHFCPRCGSQVFYTEPTEPDLVVGTAPRSRAVVGLGARPGDRAVGGLPRDGEGGLRLRLDPRRARVSGS
jgi:hypothetical protein